MAVEQITYKNIDTKTRNTIMFGLCLAMLCACLDGTIIGTCGTTIATDLNGIGLYSWMVTAYMLCECIMIPLAGKLSDQYGRRNLFLIGLGIFTVGSIATGLSVNMEMLIAFRAVQGIGGGILIPVATAAVADLYAPEVRAKMQGMMGAIFGIGMGLGPLMGGYLAEYISWRWCFYISVPFAVVSFISTIRKFPAPAVDSKPVIDFKGMVLLTAILMDIIILFEFGGSEFEWVSITTLVLVVIAALLAFLFVTVERKATEPVLSPHLVKNRTVMLACIFMLIFGIGMMGAMIYSNMFAITILGMGTLEAGTYSLAMVAGMMITAMLSGALVSRTGYRFWMIIGPIIAFAGLFMMSCMSLETERWYYTMCLFILGFGLGCMMSVVMSAVQNACNENEVGMGTSAVNLLRSIGTTVGTAIFSMLINSRLTDELRNHLPADVFAQLPHSTDVLSRIAEFPMYARDILVSFANSVDFSFLMGGAILLCTAAIGFMFKGGHVRKEE